MKIVFFCHSITSCWNNGNAHFLRGVTRELAHLGHQVVVHEPEHGWSRLNAISDGGLTALAEAETMMHRVTIRRYGPNGPDLDEALEGADVVVVHEWNPLSLVADLGRRRLQGGLFRLLFHDTHHRAVTAPDQLGPLDGYDGALVFGAVLREVYVARQLAPRTFVWHEAADTALFRPICGARKMHDLIWIGNWGDEERSAELHEFLIEPTARLRLRACIYGVRYPDTTLDLLRARRIEYGGWLPNHRVPEAFPRARVTVHVPRGPYALALPGIPTIRMFEALACGIPLISSPWSDCEGLLPADAYMRAASGRAMVEALADVLNDDDLAAELSLKGQRAVHRAHTCAHRAAELLAIVDALRRDTAPAGIPVRDQQQVAYS